MKKKSEAQIFLERVEMLDTIIESKLIEQRQWKDLALNITVNMGGEKVQSSGSPSKMADAVINCIAMEDEIAKEVEKLINEKKKVVQTIEKLYSPTEYKVLHMRYIQYIDFYEIADRFGKDYSWATTTHGRALKSVQKLLEQKSNVCDSV